MTDSSEDGRDPVELLAEEFLQRRRRGEAPALAEYIERYPDLAEDIRDLFPALLLMDDIDPQLHELGPARSGLATADAAPRQIGDYRLVRRIGTGGMGVVYEAEQLSLGRRVALKVMSPQVLGDSKAQERFRREARSAAQLHHTNIVPVFEVGQEGNVCYYAMQLIAGPGLDQVVRELRHLREQAQTGRQDDTPAPTVPVGASAKADAPEAASQAAASLLSGLLEPPGRAGPHSALSSASNGSAVSQATSTLSATWTGHRPYYRSVAHIGQQTALALAHAHARGIVHRDVKPSNLLLDESGVVWVTDFGLAKTEDDNLTRTGELSGTLRYMAPERFQGQCDVRADIYALGLTLYELLLLAPAFPANDRLHLLEHIRNREPPRPRAVDGRIPRDLETVILKAIEKDPRRRYQTSNELAADLQRFLADEPIRARRTPWYERGWRWCRRNPGWAAMLTVSFILLTAMAIGGFVLSLSLKSALDQSQQAERDRKQQLFESLVAKAEAQRFSGRVGQRFGTLDAIRKASQLAHELDLPESAFDQLRNLAVAALALPDLHVVSELPDGWPEGTRRVIFDETYEQYARGDDRGNLTIRRVADDFEIAHRTIGPTDILDSFDKGKRAVILRDLANSSWKRWRFGESEIVSLGHLPAGFTDNDATITTADNRLRVTLAHKTGTLGVYEAASGRHLHNIPIGRWPSSDSPLAGFLWSMHPWRHELAITMGLWDDPERGRVEILDLDKGTILSETVSSDRLHGLAWHPDGRTLAIGYTNNISLWDVPAKKEVGMIKDHKGFALQVGMSRSGQLLSTYSEWAGGLKFWHPYTGKPLLSVPGTAVHPTDSAPDGRIFAVQREGQRLKIWASEPSPVLRVLIRSPALGRAGLYQGTSIHPGGRLLAVGSDGGVSLFDMFTGLDVGYLAVGFNKTVRFDPVTGDLFTFGTLGLWRWPVRADANDGNRLTIGPPKRLLRESATDHEVRVSADGKTVAVTEYNQVVVFHADEPGRPIVLEPTSTVRQQVTLTPDGRWIATGCHGGGDVHIWDGRTGQLVKTEPGNDQRCCVLFTPDGKRLLVNSPQGCRFLRTGDWEEVPPRIEQGDNRDVFTPDGRFLVCEKGDGQLRLLDTTTGREVVRLGNPDQGRCNYSSMSEDGRFLATINGDYVTINVWDMHELRRQLRKIDLDWDAQSGLPAGDGPSLPSPPLQVTIDDGAFNSLMQKWSEASHLNDEAWPLVTTTPEKRNPTRAIRLIEQALRDFPDNPMFSNTLGVAQYRSGLYKEAIATLEKNMAVNHGYNAADDLFFLAMCYHQLGEGDQARACYDRGVKWMSERTALAPILDRELKMFRAEAEETLKSSPR